MANLKIRMLREIENSSCSDRDKEILKHFLSCCKTSMQWQVFTRCQWIKGKRDYSPSEQLLKIYEGVCVNG